jgi:adenylate cyclase
MMGLSLIAAGRSESLAEEAEKVAQIEGGTLESLMLKNLASCSLQDAANARPGILQLQKSLEGEEREGVRLFLIHMKALLKDYEGALDLIEEGTAKREPLMTLLKEDPLLKPLHAFDRFQQAMQKVFTLSDHVVPPKMGSGSQSLSDPELDRFKRKLEELMVNQQLFLNTSLSLRSLADQLQIHPNRLSNLLNVRFGKNFNEYINSLRLQEFQQKALDPAYKHLTLLGLAYECGFNSKTVFNTFFKRTVGVSPREWLNSKK